MVNTNPATNPVIYNGDLPETYIGAKVPKVVEVTNHYLIGTKAPYHKNEPMPDPAHVPKSLRLARPRDIGEN